MLTKEEFIHSPLYESFNKVGEAPIKQTRRISIGPLPIDGTDVSLEVHLDKNDFVDEIIIRMPKAISPGKWSEQTNWEEQATEIKRQQEEFLIRETGLSAELFNGKEEFYLGTNWGAISTTYNLAFEPDIHISIRYRNMTDNEKEKYLSLGKKYLNAKK